LRAIGALSAGFSHEFASPLNVAKLRVARALKQNSNEDLEEALTAIESCEQVIRQMNSSQLDSRDHHFKLIDLKALTQDVVDSWKEMYPKAHLRVEIDVERKTEVPPINYAQILLNLLDNALEANPNGDILLKLKETNEQIELEVRDEGPGFQALVLEKFGEPFVTTKKNGTGLGLYVTQLFAQSLGGNLRIDNHLDKGAVVQLTWPLQSRGDA
jgi:two-component system sensor histidine kinase RegB